jgi:small subunit ribosomal protein S8
MDNVGNLIGKIKIGGSQNKVLVLVSKSCEVLQILNILYKEGFISSFEDVGYGYKVFLKYHSNLPLVRSSKRYSSFSKKIYYSVPMLIKEFRRSDFVIMSTIYGIITKEKALDLNVGGEVLIKIN